MANAEVQYTGTFLASKHDAAVIFGDMPPVVVSLAVVQLASNVVQVGQGAPVENNGSHCGLVGKFVLIVDRGGLPGDDIPVDEANPATDVDGAGVPLPNLLGDLLGFDTGGVFDS